MVGTILMAALQCGISASMLPGQENPPKLTLTQVAGPVYMISGGGGGNIGLVADPDGLLMIDAMEVPVAGQIRALVHSLPVGDRVRFLVNTHWHSDHTDGNNAFGTAAVIIAQENVRPLLEKEQVLLGQKTEPLPPGALPSVSYKDSLLVYVGGEAVRLVHYPRSHTGGDTVVYVDRLKVVHMGDMFFNGMFPFLDVDYGGNIDNWVRQLDTITAGLPADAKIIPGHGPLAGVAELKAFRQMLSDSAEIVRKQVKDGKTLAQIQAAGLPERFAPWSKGFLTTPQWLELVHRSLERSR